MSHGPVVSIFRLLSARARRGLAVAAALALGGAAPAQITLTWTGDNLITALGVTTFLTGTTLNITTGANHDFNGMAVDTAGIVNWDAGNLRGGNGAFFSNTGEWRDNTTGGAQLNAAFGGSARFENLAAGSYTKTAAGQTSFLVAFNNAGAVNVNVGTLNLSGGGTNAGTGVFTTATGAATIFSNDYALADGSQLLGAGGTQITGGTFTANGSITAQNLTLTGGTLAGTQTFASGSTFHWTGGTWNASGTTTIGSGAVLNLTTGSNHDFNGRVVINEGTLNWSGGAFRASQGGTLTNYGVLNDTSTSVFGGSGTGGADLTFTNAAGGTYNKQSAGTKSTNVSFTNAGTVNVEAGILQFSLGGSSTGTINAAAGTTVRFTDSYAVPDASTLLGPGTYELTGGTLTTSGALNTGTFTQTGGTLAGTQTFASGSTFHWIGGNWNAGGTTTIGSGAVLNLTTGSNHDFNGRVVINEGTLNWSGGAFRASQGGTLTNYGVLNDTSTSVFGGSGTGGADLTFTNAVGGTYNKQSAGTKSTNISFTNAGTVNVDAGILQFSHGGSSTGTINAAADTTVRFTDSYAVPDASTLLGSGAYELTGGTLTTSGALNTGTFTQTGGTLAGTQTFASGTTFHWTGGTWNASGTTTIGSGAVLNLTTGSNHDFNGRVVINEGTLNWSGGAFRASQGGTLTNYGVLNDTSTSVFGGSGTGGADLTFTNAVGGTYNKQSAGTKSTNISFTNAGTVNVDAGILQFSHGGSSTGTINAADGTTVRFTDSYAVPDAGTLLGLGTYELTGGTLTTSGTLTTGTFTQAGGTLAGTQTFASGTTFHWTGGTWNASGTTTIASGAVLNLSTGSNHDFNGRVVVNEGTLNWSGGAFRASQGGTLTNYGVLNDTSTSVFGGSGTGGADLTFTNAVGGTYNKQSAGTKSTNISFTNAGTVNVDAGILQFSHGGSSTGTINAADGTTVRFTDSYTVPDASTLLGLGTYELTGGTLTTSGTLTTGTFTQAGGTLAGTQTFGSGTTFHWTGGTWNSAGTTTIGSGAVLNLTTGSNHDFNGRVVVNDGTLNWSDGAFRASQGGTLTNYGVINDTSTGVFGGSGTGGADLTFTNAVGGTYNKQSAGTKSTNISFTNAGTVNVEAGTLQVSTTFTNTGVLRLAGGNLSATAPLNVGSGTLAGSGTVTASTVTVGGGVAPGNSAGLLTVAGNLTLLATATSQFEIGGLTRGTLYDAIDVTGVATLGGTLSLSFLNGAYASLLNTDTFTLLTAGSLTGAFSNITSGSRLDSADGAGSFRVDVAGNTLLLSQFVITPTTYVWTGGDLSTVDNITPSLLTASTVPAGDFLSITTAADHDFNATAISNLGTVNWTGGRLRSGNGGSITNHGLLLDAADSSINADYGGTSPTFTNAVGATYRKTGTGTTSILIPFVNSGTIDVLGGVLELHSTSTFNDGAVMTGPAVLRLAAGSLTANGTTTFSNLQLAGGTVLGTQTLAGTIHWLAGDFNSAGTTTLAAGSVLNISGANEHTFVGRVLHNAGTINWSDNGSLRSWGGGRLNTAGTLNDLNAGAVAIYAVHYDGDFSITNTGTYAKSGPGTTTVYVPFISSGAVAVTAGRLVLGGGGTSGGTFATGGGALTEFASDYTLADGSVLAGVGGYLLSGGTLTPAGTITVSTLTLSGGALGGTHTFAASTLHWTAADLSTSGTTTLAATSALNIFGANEHHFVGRVLHNAGAINWSDNGNLRSWNGGRLNNSGTLNDLNASAVAIYAVHYDGNFSIANTGTYAKSGTGTTTVYVPFTSSGAVAVTAGRLVLAGGGTNLASGTFATATGALTEFAADYALADGSVLSGAGGYLLSGGTLTPAGTITVSTLTLSGGALGGTHTFAASTLHWSASDLSTSGTTTLAATSVLNISGANAHSFFGRVLHNAGTINWSDDGSLYSWAGGQLNNAGTLNDLNAGAAGLYAVHYDGNFSVTNTGTYAKSGTGTTSVGVAFYNSGAVAVTAGRLVLAGGGTNLASGTFATAAGALTEFATNYALADGSVLAGAGGYLLTSGTFTPTGTVTVSTLTLSGGALGGTHTFAASTLQWAGSDLGTAGTTTIAASSALNFIGANEHYFVGRVLHNAGTINWSDNGTLRSWNGGQLTNAGTLNDFNAATTAINAVHYDGNFSVTNTGTYAKSGTGTTSFGVALYNSGAVAVTAGRLVLAGGGTNLASGTFATAAGALTEFATNYALTDGSVLSGAGGYLLSGGTLTPAGTVTVSTLTLSGGALGGTHTFAASTLQWAGSDLGTAGTTTIAASSALNFIGANEHYFVGRVLHNAGTINWSDNGNLRSWNGGRLNNAGTLNDLNTGAAAIYAVHFDGNFSVTNTGTYAKIGQGTTAVYVPFLSSGVIDAQAGVLELQAGGTFTAGSTMIGPGVLRLAAGSLTTLGTVTFSNLDLAGGDATGTQTLAGTVGWTGAAFNGAGTTTLAGTLNIGGLVFHDHNAHALVTLGTVNFTDGGVRSGNGGSFTNTAQFNDSAPNGYFNADYGGGATFTNSVGATYAKTSGSTTFALSFVNAGTVSVSGGTLGFVAGATLTDGSLLAATSGGAVLLQGGEFAAAGIVGVGQVAFTGGHLTGTHTLAGTLDWQGGVFLGAGTTTFAGGSTLTISGPAMHDFNARVLVNRGTVNWTDGQIRSGNGGVLTNFGVWNDLTTLVGSSFNSDYGPTATFANALGSAYNKSGGNETLAWMVFDNAGGVNVSAGTFSLHGGGTAAATGVFTAASGAAVRFTSDYTLAAGAILAGKGTFELGDGVLTLNTTVGAVSFLQTGGTVAGSPVLQGTLFTWNAGTWNAAGQTATLAAGTVLTIATPALHDLNARLIVNDATVNWTGGSLRSGNGGGILNRAQWNDTADGVLNSDYGGAFTFSNSAGATYAKAAGTTYFLIPLHNAGTISVSGTGGFQLHAGGTVADGSLLHAAPGLDLELHAGTLTVSGAVTLDNFTLVGGTLAGTHTLAGAFIWTGGNLNGTGQTTTLAAGAALALSHAGGHVLDFDGRTIANRGTVNWASGYLRSGHDGAFINEVGGVFNDLNAASYRVNADYGGAFIFTNRGSYVRAVGGDTAFDVPFDNTGTVTLSQGSLTLAAGGTLGATSVIATSVGAQFVLAAGETVVLDGARFTGAGVVTQTGGTLAAETLDAAAFLWAGGTWNAAANSGLTTTVTAGAVLNLAHAGGHVLDFDGRTIANRGTVNWTSGHLRSGHGGAFINEAGGVFNDLNTAGYAINADYGGAFTFTNHGLYRHTVSGSSVIAVPFVNAGTVSVSAGTLHFGGVFTQADDGVLAVAGGATASFTLGLDLGTGVLGGTGVIVGDVMAGGLVSPGSSPGLLTIIGDLTLTSSAVTLLELGGTAPGTGYDVLNVTGTATLAGTLTLQFAHNFQASVLSSDTFTVLASGGPLSGAFANIASGGQLTTVDGFGAFNVFYGAGSPFAAGNVVLANFTPVPEPSTWALLALGLAAVALAARRGRR